MPFCQPPWIFLKLLDKTHIAVYNHVGGFYFYLHKYYNAVGIDMFTLPPNSGITWDDVYRFTGNNFIGRKVYQPYINRHHDPGLCLNELVRLVDNYIPANIYTACFKYGMTEKQYYAAVDLAAKDIAKQRNRKDEPVEYWTFVINNCWKVLEALIEGTE